jgi:hypothetical protein
LAFRLQSGGTPALIECPAPGAKESILEIDRYATVLVALVNRPRDWAIVRERLWYRIPVRSAPKRAVDAPLLAFYQSKAFGAEKWAINYYAPVRQWRIALRRELLPAESDHPRANEHYYQVCLERVLPLPHSIVSRKWRRVTFITTHWQRLLDAQEIGELLHGTIWEERLWRALRRIGRLSEESDFDEW